MNAVFVPAALDAIDRLLKNGLLDSYLTTTHRETLAQAGAQRDAWSTKAPPLFLTTVPAEQARFGNADYHGTVIWSGQQAVLAAGLSRQLARTDLPADVRCRLDSARTQLWSAIETTRTLRTSELWSWSSANGSYRAEPFGQHNTHADESNAAQLWSTVFLAFKQTAWPGLAAQ